MKSLLFIAMVFFCAGTTVKAQNIVPNPGFEVLDSICPVSYFISYSYLWESATWGTPDVFDTCLGIPQNNVGYQYAHAGKGMAGIALTGPSVYREYLEIKLDSALKDAHDYCVEFWVSMADYATVATYPPQIYFSDTAINVPTNTLLNFVPQFVDTTTFVTDTANWVLVSGTFTSYCNCQYMLIGNFNNDANTDTMQVAYPYNSAYYYIDDVSISECIPAGMINTADKKPILIYPNPAITILRIEADNKRYHIAKIKNIIGQALLVTSIKDRETSVDIRSLSPGIYYLQLEGAAGIHTERFVKQ